MVGVTGSIPVAPTISKNQDIAVFVEVTWPSFSFMRLQQRIDFDELATNSQPRGRAALSADFPHYTACTLLQSTGRYGNRRSQKYNLRNAPILLFISSLRCKYGQTDIAAVKCMSKPFVNQLFMAIRSILIVLGTTAVCLLVLIQTGLSGDGILENQAFLLSILSYIVSAFTLTLFIVRNRYPVTTVLLIQTIALIAYFFVNEYLKLRFPLAIMLLVALLLFIPLTVERIKISKLNNKRVAISSACDLERISAFVPITGIPVVGMEADLRKLDVLVVDRDADDPNWRNLNDRARDEDIELVHWTDFIERKKARIVLEVDDGKSIELSDLQRLYLHGKRAADLVAVLAVMPIAVPLAAAGALLILLVDGRPILFSQTRIGFHNRPFRIYKLRTMRRNAGNGDATNFKDNRIFWGGALLRRLRIDEIPQMWNVLKGEMSLIGPRPEQPDLCNKYARQIPNFALRHMARPGITGWAQVKQGYAADTEEMRTKVGYDLFYIKNLSLDLDIRIIAKTLVTLVNGRGAR
jgi:lipopolysaccharide/colanic/teichoic acid biosynthesis glycosyltransferase